MSIQTGNIEPIIERDIRFMTAVGPFMEAEHERHNQGRLDKTIREQKQAGVYGPEDALPQTLEEAGWGPSWRNVLTRETQAELLEQQPLEAEIDKKLIFLGNLLVENGHAEYDRINSEVLTIPARFQPFVSEDDRKRIEPFLRWKNTWVAEEHDHGPSMEAWAVTSGYLDANLIRQGTQGYLRKGLTLNFLSAADGIVFPAFQEPATTVTHIEVMRSLPEPSSSLAARVGRRVMANIVSNEREHSILYTNMVRHALDTDDPEIASQIMLSVYRNALGFGMPGMESDIPGRQEITKAYARTHAFTLGKVASEVLLPALHPDTDRYGWNISNRTKLSDEAKVAQEKIVDFAEKLHQAAAKKSASDRPLVPVILKARKQIFEELGKVA